MVCPKCGRGLPRGEEYCPVCGWRPDARPTRSEDEPKRTLPPAVWAVCWAITAVFACFGLYRGYYWLQAQREANIYNRGEMQAPSVDVVTLSDGRAAHAVTFYGDDGDRVYIQELRRSYLVTDGVARVEIADADWFDASPEAIEAAEIAFTPVYYRETGGRRILPQISLTVETPYSPLTVVYPPDGYAETYASTYTLELNVVAGSTVLVDGESVTDIVDRYGSLSVNVPVYPVGDNTISVVVETANHKQTRRDVTLYREPFEIELELTGVLPKSTARSSITISGTVEQGASMAVDTPIVEGTLKLDEDGDFSFAAQMTTIGDNKIQLRAVKEGRKDAVIALSVNYLPSLAEYSKNAWRMEYDELSKYYATWKGRVFLCRGKIVETISLEPKRIIVMNVGNEESPKYVVLENLSSVSTPDRAVSYDAYADVSGVYRYGGANVPMLIARYMSPTEEKP